MSATDSRSSLEERADVQSLEELLLARQQMLPTYAALRALHGPGDKWSHRRKAMLSAIKVRVRMDAKAKGEKVTDDAVDALAHADEQYIAFVDAGIDAATTYVELDAAWQEISERIESRKVELLSYNAETRLQ